MRLVSARSTRMLAVVSVLFVGAVSAQERNVHLEETLMEADRAFAAETLEKGVDGWVSFFTADGVRLDLHGNIVQGHDAIREADGALLSDPDRRLVWAPIDARVFSGATLGFTRGEYRVEERSAEGEWTSVSTGRYLSWWRRTGFGWKVVLDTGVPDPPSPPSSPDASEADGS